MENSQPGSSTVYDVQLLSRQRHEIGPSFHQYYLPFLSTSGGPRIASDVRSDCSKLFSTASVYSSSAMHSAGHLKWPVVLVEIARHALHSREPETWSSIDISSRPVVEYERYAVSILRQAPLDMCRCAPPKVSDQSSGEKEPG